MTVPRSLVDSSLAPVWAAVRVRLERNGLDNRGRLRLPELPAHGRLALAALIDRPLTKMLDLGRLEAGLHRLEVGDDLPAALAALGHPVSPAPAQRRASRRMAGEARATARDAAGRWPDPWAADWIDEVIRTGHVAGLTPAEAESMVGEVRGVLDHLAARPAGAASVSRTDLAATVLGSSHALDTGTRVGSAATRALRHLLGADETEDLWEQAGAHADLVSGAVLTWGLMVQGSPLGDITATATAFGIPLHLTQMALRRHPVVVPARTEVLVVENPRVVEAAAQRSTPAAVISTNGNPSVAVRLLLSQLLASGAVVRYHGDFDTPGLAICARMHALGLTPWRMGADDYLEAVAVAARSGVDLPTDDRPVPPTPWDLLLRKVFDATRAIVHQERLLDSLLTGR